MAVRSNRIEKTVKGKSVRKSVAKQRSTNTDGNGSAFTPSAMEDIRKHKITFCTKELRLPLEEARKWAERTIQAIDETEQELQEK